MRAALLLAIAPTLVASGSAAHAETSSSVSILTDYRFRGITLSDEHAVPQLSVGYDNPDGWYLGALASKVELQENRREEQFVAYAGYSRQLRSGLNWEIGAINSAFLRNTRYSYAEIFAGLTSDHISGRLYFSPDYFGEHARTIYAELNGSVQLRERLHLLGRIGYLHVLSERTRFATSMRGGFDARIGFNANVEDWTFELAWVATEKIRTTYSQYKTQNPRTLVLSVLYSF